MQKRVASHYIYWGKEYRLSYLELDTADCISGVFPLWEEIAGTAFYNGVVFPIPKVTFVDVTELMALFFRLQEDYPAANLFDLFSLIKVLSCPEIKEPVILYRLYGVDLAAAKLCTDNRRGDCHIERL